MAADTASWIFILAGSFLVVAGGIGILRLPDVYTRMHAAGVTDTLATFLLVAGMAFQAGFTLVTAKLLLIVVFTFFASPTASHALAQAALASGVKPRLAEDRRPKDGKSLDDGGAE